ncbi:pyrroline-5-carboxylate reductase [uncultured Demequina sp.]|uniref:pyrroline-5-carboxylate reductase n=1 Tax=uncultured Demequina sp. TaxID=693499 RepID=UPI0025D676CE|nr:pyrroline-5-carboxylate reductase [uncultured Demequina sp.]
MSTDAPHERDLPYTDPHGRATEVAVIGAGNMAGAIAWALADAPGSPHLRLTTRTSAPAWAAVAPGVSHVALEHDPGGNVAAVQGADAVILGVKPKDIVATAQEIADAVEPGTLVISVAAGVTVADIVAALPEHAVVVRAMPNTPVAIGRGVTGVAVAPGAPAGTLERVRALLAPTGDIEEVPEEVFDAFGALVGAAPAYTYYLIEALRSAAADQGLDPDLAARALPRIIGGAAEYLSVSGREPADLRAEVTSPGGMTHAAISTMEERGVPQTVRDAIEAAMERSRTIAKG